MSTETTTIITPEQRIRNQAEFLLRMATPTGSSGAHGRTRKHYEHDRHTIAFHARGVAEMVLKFLDGELEERDASHPF